MKIGIGKIKEACSITAKTIGHRWPISYVLKIDTLCLEGVYSQKVMRYSQRIFGPKNIPQEEQNIVSFGLNSSSVRVKDGQMNMIEGPLHRPKKCKFNERSLALPSLGDCNYSITC